jgi:tRNA U34 2-thiouridine synthase MnmA/TrmU
MVHKALEWIKEHDFDFLITGEVMGQRPMSQRKDTMPVVAKESGAGDLLLRPLSAKLLPETIPEREGWVDRNQLKDFSGRTRKPQMALAEHYGFVDYAQPAGGCCFLTDESYSVKLVDLWKGRGSREYELDDIMLLKVGRHLRPREHFKMIIGREEGENKFMEGYKKQFTYMHCLSHSGPLALIDGDINDDDIMLAARILARYSQGRNAEEVSIKVKQPGKEEEILNVAPMPASEIKQSWHV